MINTSVLIATKTLYFAHACVCVFRMVLVTNTGICTNNINGLVFVMDKQCVFSELRTEG